VTCPRLASDPPGDPCVHRFREAVAAGAVPFGVQGPENALCLDGGRTLGFELAEGLGHSADRVFVQVGGGALVTGVGDGLRIAGVHPRVHAVQTEGCAPLDRAWRRRAAAPDATWGECMWPWEGELRSAATGILDDETYDWAAVIEAMLTTGGRPVVVSEGLLEEANALGRESTGIAVDPTGSSGLAGLLELRHDGVIGGDERVAVLFTGIDRSHDNDARRRSHEELSRPRHSVAQGI